MQSPYVLDKIHYTTFRPVSSTHWVCLVACTTLAWLIPVNQAHVGQAVYIYMQVHLFGCLHPLGRAVNASCLVARMNSCCMRYK
jgi:hypothetical protein